MKFLYSGFLIIPFFIGCATAPRADKNLPARELFNSACEPGKTINSVQGTVWLKTDSKEVSGQFAADVLVSAPNQLKVEVTNILGGTEALISVQGDHYEISSASGKKEKKDEGYGSWGGIPLVWATNLFLGKIPCPVATDGMKMTVDTEGGLTVEVPESLGVEPQKFVFKFRQQPAGKPWPESLHWERVSAPIVSVDFKFDDPEEGTLSPKKWEARSSRGAVKVRWRDRNVSKIQTH